jgi:DNA-binding transcriptional regulator of glucitol operon
MRRFLTLRWLGLHAVMVVIFVSFLGLGWWQLHRAERGNALSWGYTFEWPLFAGFVVVFWVKMMRDELREAREREAGGDDADGKPGAVTEAEPLTLPAGAQARRSQQAGQVPGDEQDEELAAYNAYLAQLNTKAGTQSGWPSDRGGLRHAAAWRSRPGPPSGDMEV